MKYMAANPTSRTPLSNETEIRCNLLNSAGSGLSAAFAWKAWIDPICTRSPAIFGLTACCETTVRRIISTTHTAAGVAKLANVRVRTSRANRITIPHTTPIMCIHQSAYPTIAPAESRLVSIRNAPGATTKLKNMSLPSHRPSPRNSIVRKKVCMRPLYKITAIGPKYAMSNYKSHLFFCALLFCGPSSAHAQQIPSAIFTDPAPDKEFPADIAAPDVMSHGARLNAVLFIASGPGPHSTVVLMHGFPGNEKNLDLAYSLRRFGWNVLFPHYRGSWGSAGNFSFANAIEDTQSAVQFLREPENVKKYRIDPKKIVLIGHSMGGFMAACAAARNPEVAGLVMIAAWNIGATMSGPRETHRVDMIPAAVPRLVGTTAEGLQAEAEANAANWNYLDYAEALKTRPVLILEAHDRNLSYNKDMKAALQKVGNTRVRETYVETDHSFSDHRIALQVAVLEWLQTAFPPAPK